MFLLILLRNSHVLVTHLAPTPSRFPPPSLPTLSVLSLFLLKLLSLIYVVQLLLGVEPVLDLINFPNDHTIKKNWQSLSWELSKANGYSARVWILTSQIPGWEFCLAWVCTDLHAGTVTVSSDVQLFCFVQETLSKVLKSLFPQTAINSNNQKQVWLPKTK